MKAKKAAKIILFTFILIIVIAFAGAGAAYLIITKDVNLDAEAFENTCADLEIYDADNNALEYASSIKTYTPYNEIGFYVRNAFVAVEDKRFFKHGGLDFVRLAGAAVHNIQSGYNKEGGSTITQQLAKNALLSNEKTYTRKLKEAKLAMQIEKKYSKEEILAMYLNAIYFGNGVYGITAAAEKLFDKTPSEISLPEAAMLTGIVRSPSAYSPLVSPEKASERMKLALSIMKKEGYIADTEYENALQYEYVRPADDNIDYSYQNAAIEEAAQVLGVSEKAVITGKYRLYTYMEPKVQSLATKCSQSPDFSAYENCDRLSIVADNASGGIRAYSATFDYPIYSLRRAPGSVIKPIISYAPALDAGYISPATPMLDEKTDFDGYSPSNYGDKYLGWTTVRSAVAASSNVVSVKLVHQMGVDYAKYAASGFGLHLSDEDGLSSALGGIRDGVTPVEMTAAYMAFACGGKYKTIGFVKEIKDGEGHTVYRHSPVQKKAVSLETAYLITDMLIDTAKHGTARKLSLLPFEVASKTGTVGVSGTDKNSDAWNMSYTTGNTVCAWYGSLSKKPDTLLPHDVTGGSYPTLIARYLHENLAKPSDFEVPEGIISIELDGYVGANEHKLYIASEYTPQKYRMEELFDSKMELPEISTYFDNALPKSITSNIIEDDKIEIYFSINPNFKYTLYKIAGEDTALGYYEGVSEGYFVDETPSFGINGYYLAVTDAQGEPIGKSERTNVIFFKGPDLLF